MKAPRKHVEDSDLVKSVISEKYYKKSTRDDDEMDVDYLGLSSHS